MKNLETKDIRFVVYNDAFAEECHVNFLSQLETSKYTLWKITSSVEEAKAKLNFWNNTVGDNGIFYLLQEIATDQIIGFICVSEVEDGIYDHLGIAIGQEFIKKGYGYQILSELIKHLIHRGAKEIRYSHFKENEASKKLALKCGFQYVNSDIRVRKHDGKIFEELFYILKLN